MPFYGADAPLRISDVPQLGDPLFTFPDGEEAQIRPSLVELGHLVSRLVARVETLEARTLPARWARLVGRLRRVLRRLWP